MNHDLSWGRTVLISGGGSQFDQTVGHPLRIRIEDPDSGFTGISSAFSRIADSTRAQVGTGQIGVKIASDPIQRVLDRQPPLPPRTPRILSGGRVGPAGGTIQGRIRQTQTLCNHRFLCLRSGQLRNRIHLIQTTTHQPQTGNARQADPPASAPPEPAEPQSNDGGQTGPTPIPGDFVPHPPGRVALDPPPRSTHRARPPAPPAERLRKWPIPAST